MEDILMMTDVTFSGSSFKEDKFQDYYKIVFKQL